MFHAPKRLVLIPQPRQNHHSNIAPRRLLHELVETYVPMAMVEGPLGWGPEYTNDQLRIEPKMSSRFAAISLHLCGEIQILLEPIVADHLGFASPRTTKLSGREEAWHDHPASQSETQVVRRLVFVVHECYRWNPPTLGRSELGV